tara:strand:- start:6347 stop:7582 length:1236 start_codon:yes stop_codon:yes gene_type:complete
VLSISAPGQPWYVFSLDKVFRLMFVLSLLLIVINLDRFGIKGNPVEKLVMILTLVVLYFKNGIPKNILVLVSVILGITLISAIFTDHPQFSWKYYFNGLISFMVFLFLLVTRLNSKDVFFVMRFMCLLPFICLVVGVVYFAAGISSVYGVDFLGVVRLKGSIEAAYFGALAGNAVIASVFLLDRTGEKKYLLLAVVNLGFMLLSGSRMATAITVMNTFFLFFWGFNGRTSFKFYLTYFGVLILSPAIIYLSIGLFTRFGSDSMSGRDILWEYFEHISQLYHNFGVGLGHQYILIDERLKELTKTVAAHNEYLRLQLEIGYYMSWMVFALIGLMLMVHILNVRKKINVNFLAYASSVFSFYIFCITDNAMSVTFIFMHFWLVGLASMDYKSPLATGVTESSVFRSISARGGN